MHVQDFFLSLILDLYFIAGSLPPANGAGKALEPREKTAMLFRRMQFQAHFLAGIIELKILAQRNFPPLAIGLFQLIPGFTLLRANTLNHVQSYLTAGL